ncbi:MAG: YHS domain-containing (seleno)protein [Pseudomonadota bacterium]
MKFYMFSTRMIPTIAVCSLGVSNIAVAQEESAQPTNEEATKILETLTAQPVLPERSHDDMAASLDASLLPVPTMAALVLPVEALSNDTLAASVKISVRDPESGIALSGYDPVAYFTVGEAMLGNGAITATRNGATYHFASDENRKLFLENADQYVPAYGGYCTETLAMGSLTTASPTNWTIHGNRLFLTRSAQSTASFREHRDRSISAADKNWGYVDARISDDTQ